LIWQFELLTPHRARRMPSPGYTCQQRIHVLCRTRTSPIARTPAGGFQCSRVRFQYRHTPAYSRYTALGLQSNLADKVRGSSNLILLTSGSPSWSSCPTICHQHPCWPQITMGMAEILKFFDIQLKNVCTIRIWKARKPHQSGRRTVTEVVTQLQSQRKGAVHTFQQAVESTSRPRPHKVLNQRKVNPMALQS
jgi:hypothetical protein